MIIIEQLKKSYNSQILFDSLNFTVSKGEKVAIVGNSGSGKSTLFNILLGFELPDFGNIVINNINLSFNNISEIRKLFAWLPQNFSISQNYTLKDVIEFPFKFKENLKNKPSENSIIEIIQRLNITQSKLFQEYSLLSGGEKQRVGLAICFLLKKPILLLDEPTSALDAHTTSMVIDMFFNNPDFTILIATHQENILKHCNTIIEINKNETN